MRLLIHDTLDTAPYTHPLQEGWVNAALAIESRAELVAVDVSLDDFALIPAAEIAFLQETHVVLPEVAVVADQIGLVAMRTPVRPDEVGVTAVRLWNVSGAAEMLARATIQSFYGITPTAWIAEDSIAAKVVVVEGQTAIEPPEAGFAEDLVRAWFILTGQPFVSHLLLAPRDVISDDLAPAVSTLRDALSAAHERRRELRRALSEQHGLERDRLAAVLSAQRYSLEEADRRALLMLLQKGNRESAYPYPWTVPYLDDAPSSEDAFGRGISAW